MSNGNNRIVVCGQQTVGKTTLCKVLSGEKLPKGLELPTYQTTVGVDAFTVKLKPNEIENGEIIKLLLWEFGGNKSFEQIQSQYVKDVDTFVFVYDINELSTVERILELYEKYSWVIKHCVIVGNKIDKTTPQIRWGTISPASVIGLAQKFAIEHGFIHILTSILYDIGINELRLCLRNISKIKSNKSNKITYPENNRICIKPCSIL
jgi:small GTP-binding protein